MKIFMACLLSIVICNGALAADLGVIGDTYPIREENLADVLKQRASELVSGEKWDSLQKQWRDRAQEYRDRPLPARTFQTIKSTKSFLLDPSIELDHDIESNEGRVIAKKGARVNPLKFVTLTETLIFLDGDDVRQVKWAKGQERQFQKIKIILLSGSIAATEKQFKHPLYFDQGGAIAAKLQVEFVPAIVRQEGLTLRIIEEAL